MDCVWEGGGGEEGEGDVRNRLTERKKVRTYDQQGCTVCLNEKRRAQEEYTVEPR